MPQRVVVIGAGLAGSAAAYSLACRGYAVQVLDAAAAPAQGASALPVGLVAPHLSADDAVLSRLSRMGVAATLARASALLGPKDWQLSGVLEHRLKGKAVKAQDDTLPASEAQLAQASLPTHTPALWHTQGAWLRPSRLVQAQLHHPHIECHWNTEVKSIKHVGTSWHLTCANGRVFEAEQVVVCAAYASTTLLNSLALPLNALRGQVTWGYEDELPPDVAALLPPFPVNGMGSLVRGHEAHTGRAFWMVGSTFVRGQTSTDIRTEEHHDNLDKLKQLLPKLGKLLGQAVDKASGQSAPPIDHSVQPALQPTLHGWAAVRCTLPDRLPLVGAVSPQTHPGLHVLVGLGARGLTLSVLCGELLAALIEEANDLARASQTLNVQEPGLLKHLLANRLQRKQPAQH